MHNWILRAILLVGIASLLAACGSVATPVWEQEEEAETVNISEDTEAVAVVPTITVAPPTATPTEIPATPTFTPEPPTATPEPTEAPANDPIVAQVAIGGNAADGEALFNQFIDDVGYACSTCHAVEGDTVLIGPSQAGIASRAGDRVEGEVAQRYLYNSIIHPNDYLVEGFEAGQMPANYEEILDQTDLLNLVAYLMTLE